MKDLKRFITNPNGKLIVKYGDFPAFVILSELLVTAKNKEVKRRAYASIDRVIESGNMHYEIDEMFNDGTLLDYGFMHNPYIEDHLDLFIDFRKLFIELILPKRKYWTIGFDRETLYEPIPRCFKGALRSYLKELLADIKNNLDLPEKNTESKREEIYDRLDEIYSYVEITIIELKPNDNIDELTNIFDPTKIIHNTNGKTYLVIIEEEDAEQGYIDAVSLSRLFEITLKNDKEEFEIKEPCMKKLYHLISGDILNDFFENIINAQDTKTEVLI